VQTWPVLAPIITNDFLRGGITGLGFVNLLAGMSELAPLFGSLARRGPAEAKR
jgi:hypothetical protein